MSDGPVGGAMILEKPLQTIARRDRCRLCSGRELTLALPLKPSAIGDAFISADRLGEPQERYPLDLYLCDSCGHAQNLDVVSPELLFRHYLYRLSSSPSFASYLASYANELVASLKLKPNSFVVEIGSNDGTFLRAFQALGMRTLGSDPAIDIAREASLSGVQTIPEFFSRKVAASIRQEFGEANLVCANFHSFVYVDDLEDFVLGVRDLLKVDGILAIEITYLLDIIDSFRFDTIYHEHVSYHSVGPLDKFFRRLGMEIVQVQRVSTKGGAIRCLVQKRTTGKRPIEAGVAELIDVEAARGLFSLPIFTNYSKQIEERAAALADYLRREIASGKMIAGYGASTSATTLVTQFDLDRKMAFVVDDSAAKQGLYCPGNHIPVVPPAELYVRRPDIVLILVWQFAGSIATKHKKFLVGGGKFVVPLPKLTVLE